MIEIFAGNPTFSFGASYSVTLAMTHLAEVSVTATGAGVLPGWTSIPGAALRATTLPLSGL